mmetsp:Transcript_45311/g.102340  ORF Transcript_45311/g.102340 Transcript_45311/m.102340 type:complete len:266 (+) Transcript_45311:356-1153(+)
MLERSPAGVSPLLFDLEGSHHAPRVGLALGPFRLVGPGHEERQRAALAHARPHHHALVHLQLGTLVREGNLESTKTPAGRVRSNLNVGWRTIGPKLGVATQECVQNRRLGHFIHVAGCLSNRHESILVLLCRAKIQDAVLLGLPWTDERNRDRRTAVWNRDFCRHRTIGFVINRVRGRDSAVAAFGRGAVHPSHPVVLFAEFLVLPFGERCRRNAPSECPQGCTPAKTGAIGCVHGHGDAAAFAADRRRESHHPGESQASHECTK